MIFSHVRHGLSAAPSAKCFIGPRRCLETVGSNDVVLLGIVTTDISAAAAIGIGIGAVRID